jgi:hypothetical protein
MVQLVDPLHYQTPITTKDGAPTPLFQRQWQNLIGLVRSIEQAIAAAVAAQANADALEVPSYVTLANTATLTNERVLTAGGGISVTDAGANSTVTVARQALTGDVTASAGSNATTIANAAVTYAKIQNVTDARLLGRSSGSAGPPIEITAGAGLSLSGGVLSTSGGSGGVGSGTWTHPDIAPPLSSWFTTTANTPVLTDYTDYGLGITGAAGGTTVRYAVKSALAADTTLIARLINNTADNNTSFGIVIRDSAGAKLLTIGPTTSTTLGTVGGVNVLTWTNATTAVADIANKNIGNWAPEWIKVVYTLSGKKVDVYVSGDGKIWHQIVTANTFVTNPDQLGVYCWSTTTGGTGGVPAGIITYWNDGTNNGTPLVLLKS